jgi:hypothetical protein
MATYKVIQDIEAEDKLVGPLSLKQFIYACIAAVSGYLGVISLSKGAPYLLALFLPVTFFGGFFAFPWGRDQPTEVWALAKIRFFLKPRRRIWDQSGVKELVTVTAPKRIERTLTNNLTRGQVESRLTALASTLDSRGWAIKNVNINLGTDSTAPYISDSDRLVSLSAIPQQVSTVDITAGDDMLDEQNNARAYQLNQLMNTSEQSHRQRIMQQLKQPAGATLPRVNRKAAPQQTGTQSNQWFTTKPLTFSSPSSTGDVPPPFSPGAAAPLVQPMQQNVRMQTPQSSIPAALTAVPSLDDIPPLSIPPETTDIITDMGDDAQALQEDAQTENAPHAITPPPLFGGPLPPLQAAMPANPQPPAPTGQAMTPPPNPATIELAHRNDLTIATIANIANKQDEQPNEVVINLH